MQKKNGRRETVGSIGEPSGPSNGHRRGLPMWATRRVVQVVGKPQR